MIELFSMEDLRLTYEEVEWHRRSREIIQKYALNQEDIREVALKGLDLSHACRVLDLGCGYGSFLEKLVGRLDPTAHITGIDVINKKNREPFMNTLDRIGCKGDFIQGSADLVRDMETGSFDLVIASYSLYFFPHLIPEIARILRRTGLFLTITHSRYSLREIMEHVPGSMEKAGMVPPNDLMIHRLFQAFCLEDGGAELERYFGQVELIPYRNSLLFPVENFAACAEYIRNKRHLLFKEASEACPDKLDEVSENCTRALYDRARIQGRVVVNKDDGIFRCRLPVAEKVLK